MKKHIQTGILLIQTLGIVSGLLQPPTEGKFFYMSLDQSTGKGSQLGEHYAQIETSQWEEVEKFNVWVTTNEFYNGLITNSCKQEMCDVPGDKWNYTKSESTLALGVRLTDMVNTIKDDGSIHSSSFRGIVASDNMTLRYHPFDRELTFRSQILGVQSISPNFKSQLGGFIGLMPYTANIVFKERSLLYQLHFQGLIDYHVFAIYVDTDHPNLSSIKFGSFDERAMKDDGPLRMLKTVDTKSWNVKATGFILNEENLVTEGASTLVSFEPQLPFIYAPQADFFAFTNQIEKLYPDITCDSEVCFFTKPCSEVQVSDKGSIQVNLADDESERSVIISSDQLLISGSQIGLGSEKCAIAILRSQTENFPGKNVWYLGALMMNRHYIVYDMTSYVERGNKWLQVGIADKNDMNIIGETVYYDQSRYYDPNIRQDSIDSSIQYNGGQDIKNDARCCGCEGGCKKEVPAPKPKPPAPKPKPDPTPNPTPKPINNDTDTNPKPKPKPIDNGDDMEETKKKASKEESSTFIYLFFAFIVAIASYMGYQKTNGCECLKKGKNVAIESNRNMEENDENLYTDVNQNKRQIYDARSESATITESITESKPSINLSDERSVDKEDEFSGHNEPEYYDEEYDEEGPNEKIQKEANFFDSSSFGKFDNNQVEIKRETLRSDEKQTENRSESSIFEGAQAFPTLEDSSTNNLIDLATPANSKKKTINLIDMSDSNLDLESPAQTSRSGADNGMTLSEMDREIEKQKEEYDNMANEIGVKDDDIFDLKM